MNIYDITNQGSTVPVLNQKDYEYPDEVNANELNHMELIAEIEQEKIHIFPYLRENSITNVFYLDVYAFDAIKNEEFRFVILSGYRLNEQDEEKFLELLRNRNTYIHANSYFVKEVEEYIPKYQISDSEKDSLRMFLERCYYIANPTVGIKHMLYSKDCNYISYFVDEIEELNLIGEDIEQVFNISEDIVKYYSRRKYGYYGIQDKYKRERIRKLHEEFGEVFNKRDRYPNHYQMLYLEDLLTSWKGQKFDDLIYDYLEDVEDIDEYNKLIQYCYLVEELHEFADLRKGLFSLDELYLETKRLSKINSVLEKGLKYNEAMEEQYEKMDYLEDYEYGQYQFILARSVKEYLKLADTTHSALVSEEYIKKITEGECAILFVRCRDYKNNYAVELHIGDKKNFIDRDARVVQVYIGYCLRRKDMIVLEDYLRELYIHFDKSCFFCSCLEEDEQ